MEDDKSNRVESILSKIKSMSSFDQAIAGVKISLALMVVDGKHPTEMKLDVIQNSLAMTIWSTRIEMIELFMTNADEETKSKLKIMLDEAKAETIKYTKILRNMVSAVSPVDEMMAEQQQGTSPWKQ